MTSLTPKQEWSRMWPLAITAMLGVMSCSTYSYTQGVLAGALIAKFHWTRVQFFSGGTLQMMLGLVLAPIIGGLIDRIGPRRVGLIGVPIFIACFSALGLADGSITQWRLLCILQGVGMNFVGPSTWVTGVVGRFKSSLGLAMSVALAGTGVGTALWPIIAVLYLQRIGWRATYPALALTIGVLLLPLAIFCFFGPRDRPDMSSDAHAQARPAPSKRISLRGLLSWTYLCVILAGACYAIVALGLLVSLVPMLTGRGLSLAAAAGFGAVAGVFMIIGKLGIGYLLDTVPTRPLSVAGFLIPALVNALYLVAGHNDLLLFAASAVFGIGMGSQMNILYFITSKRIDESIRASALAILNSVLAASAGLGPLVAAAIADWRGGYDAYLLMTIPAAFIAATVVWFVPIAAHVDGRAAARRMPVEGEKLVAGE